MEIQNPAEAFTTLAVLVLGADRVGSFEERRFLFERLADHSVFDGMDNGPFAELVTDVTERVCASFPTADMRVTLDGVSQAVEKVKPVLDPELRAEAYRMAVQLAGVDGLASSEEEVLKRIRRGLGLDADANEEGGPR